MELRLVSPGEHELLIFWVQLAVLLIGARGLGLLARRFGQPTVVGELAAGLLLGPSVLGKVAPGAFDWLFPADDVQSGMLFTVAWLGALLLLLGTGFETDLRLMRRQGRAAALVSFGSLAIPFAAGIGVGTVLPDLFLGEDTNRTIFTLFMAAALSISSLPVIAKILSELGLMRRNFGQTILAAGMANDAVGWVILGVVAGLATSGAFSVSRLLTSVGGMALFLVLALTLGQRAVDHGFLRLRRAGSPITVWISMVVGVALVAGVITQWLGVEAVLGAFVAGIVLGRSRFSNPVVEEHIESVSSAVFAPIFFATAGLRVDLGLLGDPTVLTWAIVVLAVASISKFVGSLLGAKASGLATREGVALGVGLNARGAMEVVIATVGATLGVLSGASYTVVVLMAMATSVMAPPMLRAVVRDWRGSSEEQERLEREEALDRNRLVRAERVLLAANGDDDSILAASLVHQVWPPESEVTVATPAANGHDPVAPIARELEGRPFDLTVAEGDDDVAALLDETKLGYGVVAIGAGGGRDDATLLSPAVDRLLASSSVPLVIVRRGRLARRRFRRILVPVSGTAPSRSAQEIAFALGRAQECHVVVIHVVGVAERSISGPEDDLARGEVERVLVAQRVVDQSLSHAEEHGVEAAAVVQRATSPGDEIVRSAEELGADCIVLGTTSRSLEGRAYLGDKVEHVLSHTDATVVIVAEPATAED